MAANRDVAPAIRPGAEGAVRLQRLAGSGMKIEDDGRIADSNNCLTEILPQTRRLRNKFNGKDDQELEDWVTRAETQGVPTTGFKIFQDLERVNSRHTYQSWHARWTKRLRTQPRPDVLLFPKAVSPLGVSNCLLAPSSTSAGKHLELLCTDHGDPNLVTQGENQRPLVPRNRLAEEGNEDGTASDIQIPFQVAVPEQPTIVDLRRGSETRLRKFLGLRTRKELAAWLVQEWVIEVYAEYAREDLDHRFGNDAFLQELEEPPARYGRLSSKKYIIQQASDAVRCNNAKYLDPESKAGWTAEDHAIRFVARIIYDGRAAGRWWDHRFRSHDLVDLCTFGWTLMGWLRTIHSFTTATSRTSQYYRATNMMWINFLNDRREQKCQTVYSATTASLTSPTTAKLTRHSFSLECRMPAATASSPESEDLALLLCYSKGQPERAEECIHDDSSDSSDSSDSGESFHTVDEEAPYHTGISVDGQEAVSPFSGKLQLISVPDLELPVLPAYTVNVAKKPRSKGNTSVWLQQAGRDRFMLQQNRVLSSWGVTAQHSSSCILLPQVWASADPLELCRNFTFASCPSTGAPRLSFMLAGFTPSYVRAMTWYADERRGIDLDNFLGSGPFMPMEGSHLCHHGHCVNPRHCKYETGLTNSDRARCVQLAWGLRKMGRDVPRHCPVHEPPCLLQNAALTRYETFCIQFATLRRAKGLPSVVPPQPVDHKFETFEYELPLSFSRDSVKLDPNHLTDTALPYLGRIVQSPVFYCPFCKISSFRTIIGYWTHLREKERLIPEVVRLKEIQRSGVVWRDHLDWVRKQGHGTNRQDPTLLKLRQMLEDNFSWEVVMAWKLGYNRGNQGI